jgi:transposase
MKKLAVWELSDALWEKVEPFIPKPERDPNKVYKRKPGGGKKPLPHRQVFAGILYVLRTGIQWKAVPTERFGSPSALNRYFLEWTRRGLFRALWKAGLLQYDTLKGIDWTWVNIDGTMVKAPLARDGVGNNPTDRGKKRNQAPCPHRRARRSALCDHHRSQPA